MKKLLKLSFVLSLSIFCSLFAGCQKEGHGDFSLSVKSTGPDYVEVLVTAPKSMEMAYVISEEPQLVTPAILFKKGEVVTINPADVLKLGENLNEDTQYHLYAVARLDDVTFTDKVELTFKTQSYRFNEMLTLLETYEDGFKMHITVPEETKKRGNAISYGYGNLALYNMALFESRGGGEPYVELNGVSSAAVSNGDYCFRDTTVVVNDANQVLCDEDGNPIRDANGDYITIHDPYVPGEPMVFMAGESRWGSKDEFAEVVGHVQPMDSTWCVPLFDRSTMKWTGAFDKKFFFVDMPEECEATLEINIPEDGLGINDAIVTFTPKGEFFQYFYMILNQAAYDEIMTIYLNHDESLWQWFLISWVSANYYMVEADYEAGYVNAASFFTEPLTGNSKYYVLATILGDERGLTQRFVRKEFTTKERTKPAPVIEVTAVDTGDPYKAGFNIKAGTDSRGNVQPIQGAYWACEYSREWEKMLNAKYDYPTIIKGSYQTFTSDELAEVNSEAGLDVYFDILDGETLRFGAYGCNDEYCFNIIDKDNRAGWADYKAPMADPGKDPVSSPYFTSLAGEWTATATMNVKQRVDDETVVDMVRTHKSRVEISASAPQLPATLDSYIYDLYNGKSKSDVDGMFEELRELSDQFTEYRLEKQNRLLCTGFLDFDGAKSADFPVGRLDYRSPYYLFQAEDYTSVDVPQLIYDFGPKWFIEVLEDGSLIVPFNTMIMPPLTAWPGYPFYVAGVGNGAAIMDATIEVPGFPVEVSPDGNTITIKPIVVENDSQYLAAGNYYMNAVGVAPMTYDLEILGTVTTEIVLTRGWNGAQTTSVGELAPSKLMAVELDGTLKTELPKVQRMKSRTELNPEQPVEYKLDETPNIVTVDMVRNSVKALSNVKFMKYGYAE